mmetsp:Transcript_6954/g.9332  ORF Transcript_6954/g.9332 Transcript_6954/m.9332 type:complete len:253 (-) Transcript_6954:319-1077(-)|eukprot:CAMPEP_0117757806 /NCGR_PEP_ID=MMETSP0947-20121206/14966_1 /TAXON_ID=44440 /ORGANISM="Chattonella subsalsa, Strain CCMP2191" /LENGTH=252 /DNA_ID=CAMNT_0005577801 /DNA_START=177 /DNA_END=935 /DNA_ORIENTATION=+
MAKIKTLLTLVFSLLMMALKTSGFPVNFVHPAPKLSNSKQIPKATAMNMVMLDISSARSLLLSSDGPRGNGDFNNLDTAVNSLIQQNPVPDAGKTGLVENKYKGVWKVCYAPHIATLSKIFLTQFSPIEYHLLTGNKFESYVRYSSSIFGKGWLNAAGCLETLDDTTVKLVFDYFWWDIDTEVPRSFPEIQNASKEKKSISVVDNLVQTVGTIGFLESFSIFPMKYLDDDICVFEFPPLGVKITAAKRKSFS